MKAKLIAVILGTCVFTLFTNCTIEKRVFQKGYHIEWKKKSSSDNHSEKITGIQNASDDHLQKQDREEALLADEHKEIRLPTPENPGVETTFPAGSKPVDEPTASAQKVKLSKLDSETHQSEKSSSDQKEEDTDTQITPRKFEPVGIASFVFYFLGLGLGLCAIAATNPIAVLGFTAILLLTALILGIVSVVKFHRNRELYEQNFFGYFGLFASIGTLILGIFLLLIAAIIFLSGWPE